MPQYIGTETAELLEEPLCASLQGHCRRVAAWAVEMAGQLGMSDRERRVVEQAALLHHSEDQLVRGSSLARLLTAMGGPGPAADAAELPPTLRFVSDIQLVLEIFRESPRRPVDGRHVRMARLIETANLFDEQLEFLPYEQQGGDEILASLAAGLDGPDGAEMVGSLISMRLLTPEGFGAVVERMPVYPRVAQQAMVLAFRDNLNLGQMETVMASDPVLAGLLMRVASSPFYGARYPMTTIGQALNHIGIEAGRRVLLAATMKKVFVAGHKALWKHAVETAEIAEAIAALGSALHPQEAFLGGLMHDIGRLAFALAGPEFQSRSARMLERGCEPATVEIALAGFDHGEAGARVLRRWSFPANLVEGVRFHHQPERSAAPLASVLYLAEFWSNAKEDIASRSRLETAAKRAGVTLESILRTNPRAKGDLEALAA